MKAESKVRTPKEAVAELARLRDKYGSRGQGKRGGLTMKIMAAQIGIMSTTTLHFWFDGAHFPMGIVLQSLCKFLDRAKDPAYIKKIISKSTK